jgi:hypothetical protein
MLPQQRQSYRWQPVRPQTSNFAASMTQPVSHASDDQNQAGVPIMLLSHNTSPSDTPWFE